MAIARIDETEQRATKIAKLSLEQKQCPKCGFVGGCEHFYAKRRACKRCHCDRLNEWRSKNREKVKASATRTYIKYKASIHAKRKEWKHSQDFLKIWFDSIRQVKKKTSTPLLFGWTQIKDLLDRQGRVCAITKMAFLKNGRETPGLHQWDSPSLDRINAGGPYSIDNVRVVLYCVNAFRGRMTDEHMAFVARSICENLPRQQSGTRE